MKEKIDNTIQFTAKKNTLIEEVKSSILKHDNNILNIMYVLPNNGMYINLNNMPLDRNISIEQFATTYTSNINQKKNKDYEISISFNANSNMLSISYYNYDNNGKLNCINEEYSFNQFFTYVYGIVVDKKIQLKNLINNYSDFDIIAMIKKYIADINLLETFIIKCVDNPLLLTHTNYERIKEKFLILSVGADKNDYTNAYASLDDISTLNDYLDDYLVTIANEISTFSEKSHHPFCIIDVFDICMKRIIDTKKVINKCELCGKIFIPEKRSDEKFCKIPNIAEKCETCWDIKDKMRTKYNQHKDELSRLYYLIYNRLRGRYGTDGNETIEFRKAANNFKEEIKETPSDELIQKYHDFLLKTESETKERY